MINRNEADYTNFDGKTNKRIVQGPGGSSSLSLAWDGPSINYNNKKEAQKNTNYGQSSSNSYGQHYTNNNNRGQQSYDQPMNVMGNNYDKGMMNNRNSYEEQNSRPMNYKNTANNNNPIGGEHGYNLISHQSNSYNNYPPTSNKYPPQQYNQPINRAYQEKNDPTSFYKPSSSTSYKSPQQEEYDMALEQQKHKIESSRSKRGQNQSSSNSVYQQANNDTKPCVKIHQQKNNDIFGSQYDYWKQDGHEGKNNQANIKKEAPYLYEVNNQYGNNKNRGYDQPVPFIPNDGKTSVKVHNPPGGRSNFTFG